MRLIVTAYENVGRGLFWRVEPGDKFIRVCDLVIEADDVDTAMGLVWEVGNKMAVDSAGNHWPASRRSMSVSDIVVVHDGQNPQPLWMECKTIGWESIAPLVFEDGGTVAYARDN